MSTPAPCPECGATLPPNAPKGLCPKCLLAGLVKVGSESSEGVGEKIHYFGDYELVETIARGGMGVVYRARQISLDRPVALKMILTGQLAGPAEIERFHVEAEAAARLDHPNIVPVYEIGEWEGRQYFSMKLIDGLSLDRELCGKPLPVVRAATLITKIAAAVHHAHQRGILHRDLKPSNIVIDTNDEPYLTDFGLARLIEKVSGLTRTMTVMGSVPYMSPEQAEGHTRDLTTAADIYSLGAILYELLTGRPPFCAATLTETLRQVAENEPEPPQTLNRAVDRNLATICLRCLRKDPARRYGSAEALSMDLARWLAGEPIQARHVSGRERFVMWCRRKPALAAMGAAVVLLCAALVIGSIVAALQISTSNETEKRQRRKAEESEKAARTEAAKSRQTAKFMGEMLFGVNPKRAKGRDITLLKEILDRAAGRVGTTLNDQPEVEAELRHVIGLAYLALELFPDAQSHLEQARAIRLRVLGIEHPDTLSSISELGTLCLMQAKFSEAEAFCRQAWEIRKRVLGSENPDTLRSMGNLSGAIQKLGDVESAEELLREMLAIGERVLGAEDPLVLNAMQNLAAIFYTQGKGAESEALHRKVLDIRMRVLGPEDPETLYSIIYLSTGYLWQHKFREAAELLEPGFETSKKILGPEHSDTRGMMNTLAISYQHVGRQADAGKLFLQALEIDERVLGEEHADTLKSKNNVAKFYADQGEHAIAADRFRQLLEISKRVRGPESADTVLVMYNLANVERNRGNHAEAGAMLLKVLELFRREPGADTLPVLENLSACYVWAGEYSKAAPLLREIIETVLPGAPERKDRDHVVDCLCLAEALVAIKDAPGYRTVCAEMLDRFANETDAETAERLLKTVSFAADSGVKEADVSKLIERCRSTPGEAAGDSATLAVSMANYRAGHWNDAASALADLKIVDSPPKDALRHVLLAMSRQKENRSADALAELALAKTAVAAAWPPRESGRWDDAFAAFLLLQEAEALFPK